MPAPWFKKWAGDYLSDSKVIVLTYEQRGILEALWCHACKDGGVPSDYRLMVRLLPGISPKAAKDLPTWVPSFFEIDPANPSRLVSPRMLREEVDYQATIDRRRGSASKAGKASAAKRAMSETGNGLTTVVERSLGESLSAGATTVQRNPTESESESESEKDLKPPVVPRGGTRPGGRQRKPAPPGWDPADDWLIRSPNPDKPGILDLWPKFRLFDGEVSACLAMSPAQLRERLLRIETEHQVHRRVLRSCVRLYLETLHPEEAWDERSGQTITAHRNARNLDRFLGLKAEGQLWQSFREQAEASVAEAVKLETLPEVACVS